MGRPRTYRNRQEQARMIKEWEHSNLTARAFCDRHGIQLSTFQNWQANASGKKREPIKPTLIPVETVPLNDNAGSYTLHFPSGIKLELSSLQDTVSIIKQLHQEGSLCR